MFEKTGEGQLIFSGGSIDARQVMFRSWEDLCVKLRLLMLNGVPLAVGGHTMGPADHVLMLMNSGKLSGRYIEISWTRPDHWTVREIHKGANEWEAAKNADAFAMTAFDPISIENC